MKKYWTVIKSEKEYEEENYPPPPKAFGAPIEGKGVPLH